MSKCFVNDAVNFAKEHLLVLKFQGLPKYFLLSFEMIVDKIKIVYYPDVRADLIFFNGDYSYTSM